MLQYQPSIPFVQWANTYMMQDTDKQEYLVDLDFAPHVLRRTVWTQDGTLYIKVRNPHGHETWDIPLARFVYEVMHDADVLDSHEIVFKDGNCRNVTAANLERCLRKEVAA